MRRPGLRHLDLSKCRALDSDDAVTELGKIFRKRELKLQGLRLTGLSHLTRRSRMTLQWMGIAGWAFPAAAVEVGCVLLSRPDVNDHHAQPHHVRAAVLVLRSDENETLGLLLNKPTTVSMCSLATQAACAGIPASWSPEFDAKPVHFGGDAGHEVSLLHGCADIGGLEVVSGVFLSFHQDEFSKAADMWRWGKFKPLSCRWSQGLCRWQHGELGHEVRKGQWQVVHCDAHYLLAENSETKDVWSDLHVLTS